MPIAFVCNKQLTVCYSDIARRLEAGGETCYFLSPSTRWARFLRDEGWPADRVINFAQLWLDRQQRPGSDLERELTDFESAGGPTVNHVIRMCRGLSRKNPGEALAYIGLTYEVSRKFLLDKEITNVFTEGTWGFELAVHRAATRWGLAAVTPCTTRIPGDRFAFVDAVSGSLHRSRTASPTDFDLAKSVLEAWRARPIAPAYARTTSGYSPRMAHWPSELAMAFARPMLDRGDETLWPISRRIGDRIRRRLRVNAWRRHVQSRPNPQRPFVLLCLQHQPEAAVDVYGSFHSDQRALIERVIRMLPTTHDLIVREHRGALGDRDSRWFKDVASLPSVYLGNPFEDIYPLIRRASAVITVSGTVAYEAALLGTPALALANMFFSPLLAEQPGADPLSWRLPEILDTHRQHLFVPDEQKMIDFMADLIANSYTGNPVRLFAEERQRHSASYMAAEVEGFRDFIARTASKSIPAPARRR